MRSCLSLAMAGRLCPVLAVLRFPGYYLLPSRASAPCFVPLRPCWSWASPLRRPVAASSELDTGVRDFDGCESPRLLIPKDTTVNTPVPRISHICFYIDRHRFRATCFRRRGTFVRSLACMEQPPRLRQWLLWLPRILAISMRA